MSLGDNWPHRTVRCILHHKYTAPRCLATRWMSQCRVCQQHTTTFSANWVFLFFSFSSSFSIFLLLLTPTPPSSWHALLEWHALLDHRRLHSRMPVFSSVLPCKWRTDIHWSQIRLDGSQRCVVESSWSHFQSDRSLRIAVATLRWWSSIKFIRINVSEKSQAGTPLSCYREGLPDSI